MIEYKKNKYIQNALFEKIKLVLNLKAVNKVLYIKLLLKKIDLAKSLFILEIEQGEEVFIPPEISINQYPLSFRFYDSILNFTSSSVSQKTKDFHSHKNTFRLNFYQNENVQRKLLENLGMIDKPSKGFSISKLTLRHAIVNEKVSTEINHYMSLHSKGLQHSRYLQIDDDIARLQDHFNIQALVQREQKLKNETIGGGWNNKFNVQP